MSLPVGRNLGDISEVLSQAASDTTEEYFYAGNLHPGGYLPVEALIHKWALSLFGNVCQLPETAVEKQLAYRQLSVKSI